MVGDTFLIVYCPLAFFKVLAMHLFFPKSIFGLVFLGIKIVLLFWLSANYPSPFFPAFHSLPVAFELVQLVEFGKRGSQKYHIPASENQQCGKRGEIQLSAAKGEKLNSELKSSLILFDLPAGNLAYVKLKTRHSKCCLLSLQTGRRSGDKWAYYDEGDKMQNH